MKIKVVVATREKQENFLKNTATGHSLTRNILPFVEVRLFPSNSQGLSTVYNQAIKETIGEDIILLFVHDDVHLIDFYIWHRIIEGLTHFDVLGLAGNISRSPNQPTWAHIDTKFVWDNPRNLSGVVGTGNGLQDLEINAYGSPRQKVKLLDGLFLAVRSKTIFEKNLTFDEQFKFHFYDLDFCRQAETKNLTCGTWDISVIHESGGDFGNPDWMEQHQKYLAKWGS